MKSFSAKQSTVAEGFAVFWISTLWVPIMERLMVAGKSCQTHSQKSLCCLCILPALLAQSSTTQINSRPSRWATVTMVLPFFLCPAQLAAHDPLTVIGAVFSSSYRFWLTKGRASVFYRWVPWCSSKCQIP